MSIKKRPENPLDNVYGIVHTGEVTRIRIGQTEEFKAWLEELPNKTKSIVVARLDMISIGHFGDHKRFDGLLEFRWINGNRLYGFFWGSSIIVVLNGGNKNGQDRDIKKAKKIRNEIVNGIRTVFEP